MFKRIFGKSENPVVEITISNQTVVRVLLAVVITMLGLAVLKQAGHALVLIFISLFLALAFNAPVHWIAEHLPGKRRGSRAIGTAVSAILLLAVLGVFLMSIVPPIVKQSTNFIESVPQLVDDARDTNSSLGNFITRYNLQPRVDKLSQDISSRLESISGTAVSTVSSIGSSIFTGLTVLVLTLMMLIEGPYWIRLFKRLLPADKKADVELVTARMYRVIKGYVNGQVTLAAIAAILMLPILLIMQVSYPFALMFIVFVSGLIPMIGHTIGAAILSLVALFHSPLSALVVLAYYIIYQQIENYVIQPKVQANTTDMSPLLVFVAVVIGVSFSGLLGGLVAIPLMGCLRVLVVHYIESKDLIKKSAKEA